MAETTERVEVRMGIRRRTSSTPARSERKNAHLIERYDPIKRTVLCDCEWFGPEAAFPIHRKEVGAPRAGQR